MSWLKGARTIAGAGPLPVWGELPIQPILAALLLALALAGCAGAQDAAAAAPLAVRLRPLDPPAAVAQRGGRMGELHLVAAYELTSKTKRFGGISAIQVVGRDLLLLSDRAHLFRARRTEDAAGRLQDLTDWSELPLPPELRHADSEALTILPDGGLVIGTEDIRDAVFRLAPETAAAPTRLPLPDFLHDWPRNKGIEALAALPDGDLLAITEGLRLATDAVAAARLPAGGGPAVPLAVHAPDGFEPSDATVAGDQLLVIERRATLLGGLQARLLAIPLAQVVTATADDGPLDGQELVRFGETSFGENFEGVAARQTAPGHFLLYLVSDNNYSPFLRSLLIELSWDLTIPLASGP